MSMLAALASLVPITAARAASGVGLAALRNAGAADLTAEFVRWHTANPSG